MDLSNLQPAKGSTKDRKRIARGVGSGYGGHSSTRGNKGQKSVSGSSIPAWFEGGQMPLQRRLPKFGFKNPFRTEYKVVNLAQLAYLVRDGRIAANGTIGLKEFRALGLAGRRDLVKVLGSGALSVAISVEAHAFSESARQKIESVGGKATVVK